MFVILVNRWFARIDGVQMYKRFDVPTFDFGTQWKLNKLHTFENRTRQLHGLWESKCTSVSMYLGLTLKLSEN